MSREENVKIFEDTKSLCKTNVALQQAIKSSRRQQELVLETDSVEPGNIHRYEEEARLVVSRKRTMEAAEGYKDRKTVILNFASASNPGGGVVRGATAQEECICRCSSLYFNLDVKEMWDGFYLPHRASGNPLHNDDCIYTPQVMVLKTDTAFPEQLPEAKWYPIDVITCAAPNLRAKPGNRMNPGDGSQNVKISDKDLLALHEKRLRRILDLAAKHDNEVVILGAFGCGAFMNPPWVVAQAMGNVVQEYRYDFKVIEFAVYCTPERDENYRVFRQVLGV